MSIKFSGYGSDSRLSRRGTFRNLFYLASIGLAASGILFILIVVVGRSDLIHPPRGLSLELTDRSVLKEMLLFNALSLSFIIISGLTIGMIVAKLISIQALNIINRLISNIVNSLSEFAINAKWPGRRFLELLRPNPLADLRREFLSLGLEINLRVSDDPSSQDIDRLSTVLHGIEAEAEKRGYHDLQDIAQQANDQLKRFTHLDIIKRFFTFLCGLAS